MTTIMPVYEQSPIYLESAQLNVAKGFRQSSVTALNCVQYMLYNAALLWQKEASDKSDISRKRAKCVCHLH